MAANAGAPILFFYIGWKLSGLVLGVALATLVGVGAYLYERMRERPGLIARLALLFVFIQGTIGLAFGSAKVYLAQPVILNADDNLSVHFARRDRNQAPGWRVLARVRQQVRQNLPDPIRVRAHWRQIVWKVQLNGSLGVRGSRLNGLLKHIR